MLFLVLVIVFISSGQAYTCRRPLNSPTKAWFNSSTAQLMVSSPVWDGDRIAYTQPKHLEIRGMGYEPTPPGYRVDQAPFGDWYTDEYEFLWSVDLPRMAEIGVNLVRVWTWKLENPASHVGFLDTLYENGMYVLITFQMLIPDGQGSVTFKDLNQETHRKEAVEQWTRFVRELAHHPAVLGFLIGNELETFDRYGAELVVLFTVMNDMIKSLRKIEDSLPEYDDCRQFGCRHLVSTPFRADTFQTIYTTYFWANLDFWSFQPYFAKKPLADMMENYSWFASTAVGVMTAQLKPVLISERGTGSVRISNSTIDMVLVDDEDFQADFLTESWEISRNYTIVDYHGGDRKWASCMGMVVMEWNDEWWKGHRNTLPIEGCPDDDADVQSNCGTMYEIAERIVVAEEKLGICAHVKFHRSVWSSVFIGWSSHELQCKKAFTRLCELWNGSGCNNTVLNRYDRSTAGSSILILNVAPFACFFVTLVWGWILLCIKRQQEDELDPDVSMSIAPPTFDGVMIDTISAAHRFNSFLSEEMDVVASDPRLDWICDDLLRRAEIHNPIDVDRFKCMWNCVVINMAPPRQQTWNRHVTRMQYRKFGDRDNCLARFVDAVNVFHQETLSHIGFHNWVNRFSAKVLPPPCLEEPDRQLQEVILYFSVRLEHHTIGHAVEFVTENFLTMRETLLFGQQPVPADVKEQSWTALANRVDAAYNIMCNSQMHQRVALSTVPVTPVDELSTSTASIRCVRVEHENTPMTALRFPPSERGRFRKLAGLLDALRGDHHARLLRPAAVNEEERTIMFNAIHTKSLATEWDGKLNGGIIALHLLYSLETLHSGGIAHGSVESKYLVTCEVDRQTVWTLLPATSMAAMNNDLKSADMLALSKLLERLAQHCPDPKISQEVAALSKACIYSTPAPLDSCIERLEAAMKTSLEEPRKPPSYEDLNQTALDQRAKHGGKAFAAPLVKFRKSFAEQGGVLAAFCNYSFFVRYMLWQWMWSYTSQPVSFNRPICLTGTFKLMSIADAMLCVFVYLAEIRVLSGSAHRIKMFTAILHLIFYLGSAGVLLFVTKITDDNPTEVSLLFFDFKFVLTPHSMYIFAVILWFILKDIARFAWMGGKGEHRFSVKPEHIIGTCGFCIRTFLYVLNWCVLIAPLVLLTDWKLRDESPSLDALQYFLPTACAIGAVVMFNLLLILIGQTLHDVCGAPFLRRLVVEEQLGVPAMFWGVNYLIFNAVMTYFIVPGVAFIDWNMCSTTSPQQFLACQVAWIFNWLAFVIVSFALFGVLYVGWSLLASILVAFARSIGELHGIRDVLTHLRVLRARDRISKHLLLNVPGDSDEKLDRAIIVFEAILQALVDDHKMTIDEKNKLSNWFKHGELEPENVDPITKHLAKHDLADRNFHLSNQEAEQVIVTFFATLQNMPTRKGFEVQSMPSFTIIVPHYNETVYHDCASIRARPVDQSTGVPSDLRMAIGQWADEWRCLTEDLKRQHLLPSSATPDELLETYHGMCCTADLPDNAVRVVNAVERWVTFRNQTLARITRGLSELRRGLVLIAKMELESNEPFASHVDIEKRAEKIVSQKFQVLIAAQTMAKAMCNGTKRGTTRASRCQLTDLLEMQAENPFVELVFDLELTDASTPQETLEMMLHHARDEVGGGFEVAIQDRTTNLCGTSSYFYGTRYFSCHIRLVSKTDRQRMYLLHAVQRPGGLLLGPRYLRMAPKGLTTQGKAENQFHAAQFARGSNFFTLDMNQDMSITEGFKLPTMLHHFLGGNKRHRFGIIGFTEKSYTRTTSLSGEMVGAAEFAFVTIVQRMLRSALRIRMHYGHPDLMSGILARTIGFHKASHGVNVNEDIFAGYECLARGVPIGFCEWIWFWKGRDTSLRLVAMFNNKLAEGAAQQVRSRDLHFLNCNLDWLSRSSLLFGTIGFYWMSVFLYASIRLYIWALVLFEVSGVSNYEIGLVGGTISMAWAFQLGYVMALPGLIENTVQFGLLNGVIRFLRYLIASVFFHAFMLQITYEGFLTGMYTNSAAYAGTGRGYDLIPNDITRHFMTWGYSHYWKAVEFGFLLVWYAAITSESFLSYFLRTLTIWVLVLSLFGSPFYFHSPTSAFDLARAGAKLWKWVLNQHDTFGTYQELLLPEKIEAVERISYRTWYARRFASPFYAASLRGSHFLNVLEFLLSLSYRELPALALMLCYFSVPMVPLMMTGLMMVLQVAVLRNLFSGRHRRHFSRIMMITSIIFVICLMIFYFAASVLFIAPVVTMIFLAYMFRLLGIIYSVLGVLQGTPNSFIRAGMRLAMFDYPAAIVSGTVTYALAWLASNVLRDAVIAWNYSARFALEWRRMDDRRFTAVTEIPKGPPGANGGGGHDDPNDRYRLVEKSFLDAAANGQRLMDDRKRAEVEVDALKQLVQETRARLAEAERQRLTIELEETRKQAQNDQLRCRLAEEKARALELQSTSDSWRIAGTPEEDRAKRMAAEAFEAYKHTQTEAATRRWAAEEAHRLVAEEAEARRAEADAAERERQRVLQEEADRTAAQEEEARRAALESRKEQVVKEVRRRSSSLQRVRDDALSRMSQSPPPATVIDELCNTCSDEFELPPTARTPHGPVSARFAPMDNEPILDAPAALQDNSPFANALESPTSRSGRLAAARAKAREINEWQRQSEAEQTSSMPLTVAQVAALAPPPKLNSRRDSPAPEAGHPPLPSATAAAAVSAQVPSSEPTAPEVFRVPAQRHRDPSPVFPSTKWNEPIPRREMLAVESGLGAVECAPPAPATMFAGFISEPADAPQSPRSVRERSRSPRNASLTRHNSNNAATPPGTRVFVPVLISPTAQDAAAISYAGMSPSLTASDSLRIPMNIGGPYALPAPQVVEPQQQVPPAVPSAAPPAASIQKRPPTTAAAASAAAAATPPTTSPSSTKAPAPRPKVKLAADVLSKVEAVSRSKALRRVGAGSPPPPPPNAPAGENPSSAQQQQPASRPSTPPLAPRPQTPPPTAIEPVCPSTSSNLNSINSSTWNESNPLIPPSARDESAERAKRFADAEAKALQLADERERKKEAAASSLRRSSSRQRMGEKEFTY
jgi:hypothetical protein